MSRLDVLREWPFCSPDGTGKGARPLISERLGRDEGGREADSIAELMSRFGGVYRRREGKKMDLAGGVSRKSMNV